MLAFLADGDTLVIDFWIVGRKQSARAIVDRARGVRLLLRTGRNDQGYGKQKPEASDARFIEQAHDDRLSRATYSSGKIRGVDKASLRDANS
jgi:hypothetical protein